MREFEIKPADRSRGHWPVFQRGVSLELASSTVCVLLGLKRAAPNVGFRQANAVVIRTGEIP